MAVTFDPGTYDAVFIEMGTSETDSGTPFVWTTWDIGNAKRTVRTYVSTAAWETAQKKLNAIGFNGDFENPQIETTELKLRCSHRTGTNGEEYEEWEFLDWGSNHKTADASITKKLNAMWKKSNKVGAPAKKTTPPPTATSQVDFKQQAWDAYSETINGTPDEWSAFVTGVVDKPETDMTPADWKAVLDAVTKEETPF